MIQARWLLIALLFLSGAALADASDYDYIEAGYAEAESNGLDFDGFGIRGSFKFYDNFYLTLGYADTGLDTEIAGVDADGEQLDAAVGYIFGENERGTFFGEVTYVDVSFSASGSGVTVNADADGFGVGFGWRVNVGERGEVKLSFGRQELDSISENFGSVQIVYDFFPKVSGVLEFESAGDADGMLVGVRYTF